MGKETNRNDNNFKRAIDELLGYLVDEGSDVEAFETEGPQFFDMSDDDEDEGTTYSTVSSVAPHRNVEAAASAAAPDPIPEPAQ